MSTTTRECTTCCHEIEFEITPEERATRWQPAFGGYAEPDEPNCPECGETISARECERAYEQWKTECNDARGEYLAERRHSAWD